MEVKKIVEGMTAPQVAQVIDDNFNGLNTEKASKEETNEKLSELGSEVNGLYIPIPNSPTEGSIDQNGIFTNAHGLSHLMLNVKKFKGASITIKTAYNATQYAFCKSYDSTKVVFINGGERINGYVTNQIIPQDANYLYLLVGDYISPTMPTSIITSLDNSGIKGQIAELESKINQNIIDIQDNSEKTSNLEKNVEEIGSEIDGRFIAIPEEAIEGNIDSLGNFTKESGLSHIMLDVRNFKGATITIVTNYDSTQYAFCKSYNSFKVVFADGGRRVDGYVTNKVIPSDANYLYLLVGSYQSPTLPTRITTSYDKPGISEEIGVIKHVQKQKVCSAKDSNGRNYYQILIPTSDGKHYIHYDLKRVVDSGIKADNLRIIKAWLSDGNADIVQIITDGEWEMAIQLVGRPDFIGGGLHGDEVIDSLYAFIDGKILDYTIIYPEEQFVECDEFVVIEITKLYDPSNPSTQVATHRKHYSFTKEGLRLKQRIEWLGDYDLTNSYLAMLPMGRILNGKQITDGYYDDKNYIVYNVANPNFGGYPIGAREGVSVQNLFGGDYNISARVEILKFEPSIAERVSFLSDSEYYNKMYFDFCGNNYSVKNGDVWTTDVLYKINKA